VSLTLVENDVPGLCEEDMEASVATLRSLAETLGTECVLLRQHPEKAGHIAEYLLRSRAHEDDFMEVRYCLVHMLWRLFHRDYFSLVNPILHLIFDIAVVFYIETCQHQEVPTEIVS